jgi:hypothetical protein
MSVDTDSWIDFGILAGAKQNYIASRRFSDGDRQRLERSLRRPRIAIRAMGGIYVDLGRPGGSDANYQGGE